MQYDFSLDGTRASSVGIVLQKPATVSPLVPRYIEQIVPKYGTYHIFDGYEDRRVEISAYLLNANIVTTMQTAYNFLCAIGQRTIVLYADNTAYFTANGVFVNGGQIDLRNALLNPFTMVYSVRVPISAQQ